MMTMMLKEKYEILPVFIAFFAIMELTTNLITFAHREHKVHNIVLYPDKHSWCKTLAIKQVISYPGCKSEEIDNNVCVGTCFSYSIPHTEPSDPGEVIVPYCDSCQPSDTTWHHVTLECTKNSIDTPPQLVKRVQIINNCSCTSCEKSLLSQIHSTNQYNDEDDNDLIMSHVHHHDVPDVLKILNRSNTIINDNIVDGINGNGGGNINNPDNNVSLNNISTIDKFKDIKQILNHKIITLLKNIQENNSIHDKEQLMDLLRMIQGPNSKLNDKNIEDFVNSLHSENIELDIPRLREILIKFEHSKYYEKHRRYFDKIHDNHLHHNTNNNNNNDDNVGIDDNNNDGNHNMNQNNSMHTIHHSHSHHQQHHHHHHHYDEGLTSETIENNEQQHVENLHNHEQNEHDRDNNDQQKQQKQQQEQQLHSSIHHITSHHHHQHHIGENIIGHGHLTRGPHGALVIEPEDHHHVVVGSEISDVANVRNNNNNNNNNNENNKDNNDNVNDNDDDDGIDDDNVDDIDDIENNNNHHPHNPQHEKLDVNPHELKPNHAGTLLSYSGHSSSSVDNSRNP